MYKIYTTYVVINQEKGVGEEKLCCQKEQKMEHWVWSLISSSLPAVAASWDSSEGIIS